MKKKYNKNNSIKRSCFDRRVTFDRRQSYLINYFEEGGKNRRITIERRKTGEERDGWQRYTKWQSIYVGE